MQQGRLTGECFTEALDSAEGPDKGADEVTENAGLEAETCTCIEISPPQTSERYSMRCHVKAPDRLLNLRAGRALYEGGSGVAT